MSGIDKLWVVMWLTYTLGSLLYGPSVAASVRWFITARRIARQRKACFIAPNGAPLDTPRVFASDVR